MHPLKVVCSVDVRSQKNISGREAEFELSWVSCTPQQAEDTLLQGSGPSRSQEFLSPHYMCVFAMAFFEEPPSGLTSLNELQRVQ